MQSFLNIHVLRTCRIDWKRNGFCYAEELTLRIDWKSIIIMFACDFIFMAEKYVCGSIDLQTREIVV